MVFSAQCRLLGGGHGVPVTTPRFSTSSSSSSLSVPYPRCVITRASSSSSPPVESSPAAAATSSSTALEAVPEPESASMSTLEIPPRAGPTSTSLVSRTPQIVLPDGAVALAQVNHYRILKIPYGSTSDMIIQAYKDRVEEVKSREKELGKEATEDQFRALKASYDILNSEEERRVYDWVLQRYENRLNDSYIWPYQTDITQKYTNKEPPPVLRSFDQEGNNRVGLFLLGWVIISIIFGVTMKTWVPYPHWRNL